MHKTIGILAGAFKPFHSGHYEAVKKVAEENDKVYLVVSVKDRKRKGEFPIYWKDMEIIWKRFIKPILPSNIKLFFVDVPPITKVYDLLSAAEENPNDNNSYYVYASKEDATERFSAEKIKKYFPRLFAERQIEAKFLGLDEERWFGSGTEMRFFLQNNNIEEFVKMLPEPLKQYGQQIFNILSDNKK